MGENFWGENFFWLKTFGVTGGDGGGGVGGVMEVTGVTGVTWMTEKKRRRKRKEGGEEGEQGEQGEEIIVGPRMGGPTKGSTRGSRVPKNILRNMKVS